MTTEAQWTAVDAYLNERIAPSDAALEAALRDSAEADLPAIAVSATQGKLLGLLAQATGARKVLEIGTLGGYSSIWLARALPAEGRLITLELSPKHAEVARKNLARAGVSERVEVKVGPALESLPELQAQGRGPFDLIFIDADKASLPQYFGWALKLARLGTLIVIDNVVRRGAILDEASRDPNVQGVRQLYDVIAAEPRVTATAIQTVGSKGYDGLAFALVTSL